MRDNDRQPNPELVPLAGTARTVWPGSRPAPSPVADGDILLTAWLRPRPGGDLNRDYAQTLGGMPPLHRTYADRKTLARQTGADSSDVDVLRRYCEHSGLEIVDAHWRSVTISGPIDRLVRAFGATVAIHEDQNRRRFRHRSRALHAPADVAAVVRGIFGMHQWPRSRRLGALQRTVSPLRAGDVAARYRFPDAVGEGQTVGVLQLRGAFKPDDFDRCLAAQGLASAHPVVKRIDNAAVAHEIATTKDLEATLDVQIIASLAPGARIVAYETPDDERGFLDGIRAAIFDEEHLPDVLSLSYGWPEHLWTPVALTILDELFVAAALVGTSVFCSSGDDGAELGYDGRPHALAPASSPFAIGCGATVIPNDGSEERAWEKSGGGFSERFDAPPWQDVARSEASRYGRRAGRGIPDVAGQQFPGYYVVMDGVELAMGGTSAIAPMWAALTARLNQRLGVPIGFFAPILYRRCPQPLFTEITSGGNDRFAAAAGWSPCVGLGVPDGTAIEKALREPST